MLLGICARHWVWLNGAHDRLRVHGLMRGRRLIVQVPGLQHSEQGCALSMLHLPAIDGMCLKAGASHASRWNP